MSDEITCICPHPHTCVYMCAVCMCRLGAVARKHSTKLPLHNPNCIISGLHDLCVCIRMSVYVCMCMSAYVCLCMSVCSKHICLQSARVYREAQTRRVPWGLGTVRITREPIPSQRKTQTCIMRDGVLWTCMCVKK